MAHAKTPMKWYRKLWVWPMMLLNVCCAAVLMLCAFSQQIPAARFPLVSITGLAFPFALVAVVVFLLFWLLAWKRGAWLSLLTLLICASPIRSICPLNVHRQAVPEDAFRVLSYNICSTNVPSGKLVDTPTLDYIREQDADIVCLQECNVGSMRNIDERSAICQAYPYRAHTIVGKDLSAHGLDCLSKYPILDVQDIAFDDSGNGAARYLILMGNDTLAIFNCHLQSFCLSDDDKVAYGEILDDPREHIITTPTKELVKKLRDAAALRATQADDIAHRVEATHARYTIVCGDFNDAPVSYAHHRLTRQLMDAHTRSGNGFDFSYTDNRMFFRIDHILASRNLESWHCRVHRDATYSDHRPISAYFTVRE